MCEILQVYRLLFVLAPTEHSYDAQLICGEIETSGGSGKSGVSDGGGSGSETRVSGGPEVGVRGGGENSGKTVVSGDAEAGTSGGGENSSETGGGVGGVETGVSAWW